MIKVFPELQYSRRPKQALPPSNLANSARLRWSRRQLPVATKAISQEHIRKLLEYGIY